MSQTVYRARKRFSIFGAVFNPGDVIPIEDLKRIPRWEKMERTGFVVKDETGD